MSLIDLYKGFHERSVLENYPGTVRAMYYVMMGEFNARYWPREMSYSERELSGLTGLSNASVHRAIKYLADRGHIKTWHKGNRTIIQLLGVERSTPEAKLKQEGSKAEAKLKREALIGVQSENGCERGSRTLGNKREEKTSDEKTLDKADAKARAREELVEYWERDLRGGRLSFEHMAELESWIARQGKDYVKAAMKEASDGNGRSLNMRLLRKVISDREKGGERNGAVEPDYSWI